MNFKPKWKDADRSEVEIKDDMDFVDPTAENMWAIVAEKHHEVRWFTGVH